MTRPANLIFFLSDNHNRQVTGCYGHGIVRTPTLDKLAARGVRFENSYCASTLCVPSRASLATGRYVHQNGCWDNAIAYDGKIPGWMHRLRDSGHHVAAIGKLHFRSGDDDNGFSEEIMPMHLHEGKGAVRNLLRGFGNEPACTDGGRWKLYAERSGVGETHYQDYDRKITAKTIEWLRERKRDDRPWALYVGYISPHPPFSVPRRLLDLYPLDAMPLPVRHRPGDRPEHPSMRYMRELDGWLDMTDEPMLRRVAAGYFGLLTHLDEQIGAVMKEIEALGLLSNSRVVYSSDHGELFGAQGIFGKKNLYEGAVGVPLIAAGTGIPEGTVVRQLASHVDLFPTFVESVGARMTAPDSDLPGISLWPAIGGREDLTRPVFAEYHAQGSRAGAFMLRQGDWKLVYHVGMPAQLFNLRADPDETRDLVEADEERERAKELEAKLRTMCDPEAIDARAKADQRRMAEAWGGPDKLRDEVNIIFTPPPGVSKEDAWRIAS
ncbi:MAG TPA: sulfatase-like hydrolase/transferase [Burkholderiales bacterium]|nr:sulfatase-like hydrolase/transferase [Burkholderiales bacterium]